MKEVLQEYAGAVTGVMGALGFFVVLGSVFYSETGFFAELIQLMLKGG